MANGFSRMQEHAADVYGLEIIHGLVPNSEEVAAHGFQVLGELDLSDPNPPPFITFWLYSHPPLAERLVSRTLTILGRKANRPVRKIVNVK